MEMVLAWLGARILSHCTYPSFAPPACLPDCLAVYMQARKHCSRLCLAGARVSIAAPSLPP
jgi:hypothetical protein